MPLEPVAPVIFSGDLQEMVHLAGHRTEAAHLPHQPLQHRHLPAQVGGPELAGLLAEVDQNGARLEDADWCAARALGVDDCRDFAVWADLYESGLELLAFGDVDRLHGVGQAHLLERDTDLAAVRGIPGVEFNAHRALPFLSWISCTHHSAPNGWVRIAALPSSCLAYSGGAAK